MPAARRIVFPEIKRAAWEETAVPGADALRPTEVLVRTGCTLVSAGTEIAIFSGSHIGYTIPGSTYPRLPHRPGYAFAGTVEAVGANVTTLRPGDRVGGSLNHMSAAAVEAARLTRLPEGVSFEQACLARLAAIAMQGVRLAGVRLGERAAVFGQGLIGQLARQLVVLEGAETTIGIDLIDARLEIARRHGATHTINPSSQPAEAAVAEITGGRGVDVAIEATGSPAAINQALKVAADLGRVILLGSPRGRVEIDPYSDIHRKGVAVIGAHARTADLAHSPTARWNTLEQYRLSLTLMAQRRLHTDGLVSHRVPAAESLGVFDALTERPHEHLGVLIDWS